MRGYIVHQEASFKEDGGSTKHTDIKYTQIKYTEILTIEQSMTWVFASRHTLSRYHAPSSAFCFLICSAALAS